MIPVGKAMFLAGVLRLDNRKGTGFQAGCEASKE